MRLLAVAATSMAVALAGCGGSDKSSSPGTSSGGGTSTTVTTMSGANYKTVLKQIVTQIQTLTGNPPPAASSPADQAKFAQSVQSAVSQARDQLAALHLPGRLAAANAALVTAFGKYADLLGQLATAAKKQDKAAIAGIDAAIRAETVAMKNALAQAQQGG